MFTANTMMNIVTWEQTRVLPGHRRGHVAFSPDGASLISGGLHKNAIVFDATTWQVARTLYSTGGVWDLAFAPCGSRLAILQPNSERDDPPRPIEIRDTRTWRIVRRVGVGAVYVNALSYSPDGGLAAVAPTNGPVGVWDADFTENIAEFAAHERATWGMAFSPNEATLATGGANNVGRLWDTATWQLRQELRPEETGEGIGNRDSVLCVAYSPDGTLFVTDWLDGSLTVWQL